VDNERSGCPDHDELASYLDGRLATEGRDAVEAHLLECAECRAVVVEAAAIAAAHPTTMDPPDR
jgi:anti-sigma factor RsiW